MSELEKCSNGLIYPEIDPEIVEELSDIPQERINNSYRFFAHNILQYGIDAITHIHFLRMAQAVSRGELSLEELKDRFKCIFHEKGKARGFGVKIDQVESDGIFIPSQIPERDIQLFNRDYINKFGGMGGIDTPLSHVDLMERQWQLNDFQDPEIMRRAEIFAHDLFAVCALTYTRRMQQPAMAESRKNNHYFGIFDKLLEYYTKIAEHGPEEEAKRRSTWLLYTSECTPIPGDTLIHMGNEQTLQELVEYRRKISEVLRKEPIDPDEFTFTINSIHTGTRRQLVQIFSKIPGIMVDL